MKRLALSLLLALALAAPAGAITRPAKGKKPAVPEAPAKRARPPAPVSAEGPLSELAETMGALALLADLCRPDQKPNPWRVRMEGLVEAEGEASGARERMNGGFNRGYADFATSYSRCTPAAKAADEALRREAGRLARGISQKFGE